MAEGAAKLPGIHEEHLFAVRLMEHLVVPTFVLNAEGEVIIWNKACERLTGVKAADVLDTKNHWRAFYDAPRACLADILVQGGIDTLDDLYTSYTRPDNKHQGLRAENWCVMPNAAKRLYLAINSGPIYNDTGELIAVVETLRDMTEQKQAENALQSLAHKDGLTGMANRRSFDIALEADLLHAKREQASLALLLCDIDHFKPYNDLYGHLKGDQCLKVVANAIGAEVKRPSDLAARYGGEEFVVLLPGIGEAGALRVAERIRCGVYDLNECHKGSETCDRVSLSIGLACIVPGPEMSECDLIELADKALYTAKESGRNRVVVAPADA